MKTRILFVLLCLIMVLPLFTRQAISANPNSTCTCTADCFGVWVWIGGPTPPEWVLYQQVGPDTAYSCALATLHLEEACKALESSACDEIYHPPHIPPDPFSCEALINNLNCETSLSSD